MNLDISKYVVPILGSCCVGGVLLVASAMRTPVALEESGEIEASETRIPESLVLDGYVPTMEEVLAKHLFVPERAATGENAFPDLLVKGVYVGTERNAVFSLKSKPAANLRVWQGDEEAALAQVVDERDPRKPIADFLHEWQIRSIDFSGVTLEHVITGEKETYAVDYKPVKHAKDSAQGGYGQGMVVDRAPVAKAPSGKTTAAARPAQARAPASGVQSAAGRVGAYMQRMSPQQRQQFMQQLQKQNAAAAKKGGASQNKSSAGGGNGSKKSSSRKSR
jgi:hypothetical protein